MEHTSRLPGFYKRPLLERRRMLVERFGLDDAELAAFESAGGLSSLVADKMVENAVGVLGLPLGLALNFVIDGEAVLVPMAVEEPSVVAACSYIARLAAEGGGFVTDTDPPHMIGQVQLLDVADIDGAIARLEARRVELMAAADENCRSLVARGGGCVDLQVRRLPPLTSGPHADLDDEAEMLVVHFVVDCRDAMGANAINTVVEGVAPLVADIAHGRACLRILSNLADRRRARARMCIPYRSLEAGERAQGERVAGREVARCMVDAYRLAARDPYRAATHNKGLMNGVDAVAIATGNDWRALEAGAHAFAAQSGRYTSLTRFWLDDDAQALRASAELPMAVGVVGGSTRVHPTVRACLKLLGPFGQSARRLGGLLAAVGLAQNAGALRALATEGIQRGHMELHARQVALAAGAREGEVEQVAERLVTERAIGARRAGEILGELRELGGGAA
jgi:hydroxymethylglutaryl-CoA reductase